MSKRTRICTRSGKQRFESRAVAEVNLGVIRTRSTRGKQPVRVYECKGIGGCKGWHLTSQPKLGRDGLG